MGNKRPDKQICLITDIVYNQLLIMTFDRRLNFNWCIKFYKQFTPLLPAPKTDYSRVPPLNVHHFEQIASGNYNFNTRQNIILSHELIIYVEK